MPTFSPNKAKWFVLIHSHRETIVLKVTACKQNSQANPKCVSIISVYKISFKTGWHKLVSHWVVWCKPSLHSAYNFITNSLQERLFFCF